MPSSRRPYRSLRSGPVEALLPSWHRLPPKAGDVLVTVAGTAAAAVAVLVSYPSGLVPSLSGSLLVAVVCALPLLLRRTRPEAVLVAGLLATLSTDNATPLAFGAWAVGRYGRHGRAAWLTGAGIGYAATSPLVEAAPWNVALLYHLGACVVAPGLFGDRMRRQVRLVETVSGQLRQVCAGLDDAVAYAVLEERTRLSYDMHDSVGHHVAVVSLQAAAIRARADRPADVRKAAVAVEESARAAMAELRAILDVLRRDPGDPVPPARLARSGYGTFLEALVSTMASAGLDVGLSVQGTVVPLPVATQSVLYRVGREGITNAIRHGSGAPVRLRLHHQPDHVDLFVENGPPRGDRPRWQGCGIGLEGLRRRVGELHGALTAGPTSGGGFVLHARIPVPAGAGGSGPTA